MSTNKLWKASVLATAVVALAGTVAGCDPYIGANTAKPVVLGTIVVASSSTTNRNYNYDIGQLFPPAVCPGTPAAQPYPYPAATYNWFKTTYPGGTGNCGDGTDPSLTLCPETCWPPRTGPAFAPYFLGDTGASYGCDTSDPRCVGGKFTYTTSSSYTITNIQPGIIPAACIGLSMKWNQLRIVFNKEMDGSTIQTLAANTTAGATCDAAPGIVVTKKGLTDAVPVDVTAAMNVCYVPSSSNVNWGASMTVQPRVIAPATSSLPLDADTTYHVTGTVKDHQGNSLDVDATFVTKDADFTALCPP